MQTRARIAIPDKRLKDFCRRWQVCELALFGSVLRADFRDNSDVDVLVQFMPDAGWDAFDLLAMQDELETLLGRKVDLVERDALRNPFRRAAILNSMKVVYGSSRT